jgi:hypothetical protein
MIEHVLTSHEDHLSYLSPYLMALSITTTAPSNDLFSFDRVTRLNEADVYASQSA